MGRRQKDVGAWAEQIAVDSYVREGYAILERNYRPTPRNEVDIIVRKDNVIAFVEVKCRREGGGDPMEAVNDKKIRHIVLASDTYMHNMGEYCDVRYDVVLVYGEPDKFEVEVLKDAFIPPLFSR